MKVNLILDLALPYIRTTTLIELFIVIFSYMKHCCKIQPAAPGNNVPMDPETEIRTQLPLVTVDII